MVTVTIDEVTLNATRAALDERVERLTKMVALHQGEFTYWLAQDARGQVYLENTQRALVWNIAALHETELAREFFAEVQIIDHPADATWTSA